MFSISLRDLQFRMRRVVIAIVGTGLVFSLGLVGSGLSGFFRGEVRRTIDGVGADAWLVAEGVSGPFTSASFLPASSVDEVARQAGVTRASGIVVMRGVLTAQAEPQDVGIIGFDPGGLGAPSIVGGSAPHRLGEVALDETAKVAVGSTVTMDGRRLRVTGLTSGQTFNAGHAMAFLTIAEAQALAFGGRQLISAVITRGRPTDAPPGLRGLSPVEVQDDLMRPLAKALSAIDFIKFLMWLVAATIIGAVVYLSALERLRDFAVLRAVGSSSRQIFAGLLFQAVVISVLAAVVSMAMSTVMAPAFPIAIEIPSSAFFILPAVAIGVGAVASIAGLRRTLSVDPAMAFGGGMA